MPCEKCQKLISQVETDPRDEEEIIKGLINCKECSDEIVNRCHTCRWPIYKKELIYGVLLTVHERITFGFPWPLLSAFLEL